MSTCHHDASLNDYNPNPNHNHEHDHNGTDVLEEEFGAGESLYPYLDTTGIQGYNIMNSINTILNPFKPYHERKNHTTYIDSIDDDPEMIIQIPFTESVNIKSICISGNTGGSHPKYIKIFTNRNDIDFSNVNDIPSTQEIELIEDLNAEINYPLHARKFQGIGMITLYITDSYSGDFSRIYNIGFKGESKHYKHGIVECVYESKPQPSDHKISDIHKTRNNVT